MNRAEQKQKITEQVNKYMDIARELYPNHHLPNLPIDFSLKGRCMGQYHPDKKGFGKCLRFNLDGFQSAEGAEHLVYRTCPHEVAHYVQYTVEAKDRKANPPHGHIWKRIMRQFGVEAKRCHSIDLPSGRQGQKKQYRYSCNCKSWDFTIVRHRRARTAAAKGKRCYSCPSCKTPIKYSPDGGGVEKKTERKFDYGI